MQVPVPTPVQSKQPTAPRVRPVPPPQPPRLKDSPLTFGGEHDKFGNRVQGVSAVILPWSPQPKRMSRPRRYAEGEQSQERELPDWVEQPKEKLNGKLVEGVLRSIRNRKTNTSSTGRAMYGVPDIGALGALGDHLQEIGHPIGELISRHVNGEGATIQPSMLSSKFDNYIESEDGTHKIFSRDGTDREGKPITWVSISHWKKVPTGGGNTRLDKLKSYAFHLPQVKKLSRKKVVVRYGRPILTPAQKIKAKKVELIVLPSGVSGKSCGTCQYTKKHSADSDNLYCTNNQVHMNVKANWGCKLWNQKGVKRLSRKVIILDRTKNQF